VPEGDTIFRLVRRMEPQTAGRLVTRSEVRTGPSAGYDLAGRTLLSWRSVGKHMLTRFSGGESLHSHLEMDGSWRLLPPGRRIPRDVDPDVRVVLELGGPTLIGILLPVVELIRTSDEDDVVGHLGPDLLGPGWDLDEAVRRLQREPDRPIVEAILDQRNLAGIGNLWANETCFLRGAFPWRPVGSVDLPGLLRLVHKMIRYSAATDGRQITTGNTRRGQEHWVYGRSGRACLRCGTKIRFRPERPGEPYARATWWCPTCQPETW
jgi:formamidopyrimidine-DNA glycosylase